MDLHLQLINFEVSIFQDGCHSQQTFKKTKSTRIVLTKLGVLAAVSDLQQILLQLCLNVAISLESSQYAGANQNQDGRYSKLKHNTLTWFSPHNSSTYCPGLVQFVTRITTGSSPEKKTAATFNKGPGKY